MKNNISWHIYVFDVDEPENSFDVSGEYETIHQFLDKFINFYDLGYECRISASIFISKEDIEK